MEKTYKKDKIFGMLYPDVITSRTFEKEKVNKYNVFLNDIKKGENVLKGACPKDRENFLLNFSACKKYYAIKTMFGENKGYKIISKENHENEPNKYFIILEDNKGIRLHNLPQEYKTGDICLLTLNKGHVYFNCYLYLLSKLRKLELIES